MPKNNSRPAREARRIQAEARQIIFDALTPEQKFERILSRRGESKRERARLSS